ncbi:class I SAM-dependent methyltransferase [Pseudosulfitobacter koreensis]|uniref:class I SAM-dependent methyltransferase n=1 Tax=Pseudosulfitobacter koreensis TaxID=2968472 RepID=UPI002FCCD28A
MSGPTASLALAQRGAIVTGVDFSSEAIRTATALATELGRNERASFIECNVYDTLDHLPDTGCYDLVYVTWGCIGWLPDVTKWAAVVTACLKPGGVLYLADGHPSALVFDDCVTGTPGKPGWFVPYFEREPLELDETQDYSNAGATLKNSRVYAWMHGLGEIASALMDQGLEIRALRHQTATGPHSGASVSSECPLRAVRFKLLAYSPHGSEPPLGLHAS